MRFKSGKPSEILSESVENFWLYEGYEGEHANERILPTGTLELVINLRENELRIYDADEPANCSRYSGAVVSGAYGKGFVSDSEEEAFIIGVHFKPGGAFPFLGPPADELVDSHVDLGDLWGGCANLLREQLCEASTAQERFQLLEAALIERMFRPPEHHYAVSTALESLESQPEKGIREIAKDVGLSQRRFAQLFKREVGMTPKLFSRVQRFQRLRASIHRHETTVDWASLAVGSGYSDQSHMIREFVEFSGISPANYLDQYRRFLEESIHIKRYHFPVSAKAGQFYPIQQVTGDDIISLGGNYVSK
jgi:AraC-like DNA-binding protein